MASFCSIAGRVCVRSDQGVGLFHSSPISLCDTVLLSLPIQENKHRANCSIFTRRVCPRRNLGGRRGRVDGENRLRALLRHGQAELTEDVGEAAYSNQLRSFLRWVYGKRTEGKVTWRAWNNQAVPRIKTRHARTPRARARAHTTPRHAPMTHKWWKPVARSTLTTCARESPCCATHTPAADSR